ncbi:hypothetical protein [Flavisolibacter ginsenosidimutans]|uniref:Uncharacterized protein n=1 Tax=Flavisolibacter ginsenosidimutans TaxID=661481 RepID=A0A5B8UG60_9BACT|nr:hypothetical protein [Flavisolibacter ginsenosidimutans]QEC55296.1 hypothetical protein FSB75_05040 [Flavisolibacter ginsenosidimutans]
MKWSVNLVTVKGLTLYRQLRKLLEGYKLKDMVMCDYDSLDANVNVNKAIGLLQQNYGRHFIVTNNGLPVAALAGMEVMKALTDEQYDAGIGTLMKDNFVAFDGDKPAVGVLEKLSSNEEKLYPVREEGTLPVL